MNRLKLLGKYSPAITFLAFEFFALMAFNFSGSFILFGSLSLALCILLILFNISEIKVKGLSNVALFFIPLFMFVLLTTVGNYTLGHAQISDFSWSEVVFITLGLLPMAFNGYMLSVDKHFKVKTFIIVVFSALAIYVLINFIYNLISFGAFYPVFYKGYYLYYNGIKSDVPVNEMAYTLEGFKFLEVKMSHYVLYPLILLSSSVMLLYTSPKKEKVYFYTFLAFTLLSILSLALIPSYLSIGGIIFVAVMLLLIYFAKRYLSTRKVFKYILYIGLALFVLFFLFYVISFSTGLSDSFSGLVGRIFNNKYSQQIKPLLINLFSKNKFFGFAGNVTTYYPYFEETHLTGFFIFDVFMSSGVIGALMIFIFIYLGFRAFGNYFKSHCDEFKFQATLLMFVIVFFTYSAFFNNGEYALFYRLYKPIYLTSPFMIMIFIFSYVICKSKAVDQSQIEKVEETVDEK